MIKAYFSRCGLSLTNETFALIFMCGDSGIYICSLCDTCV